MHEVIFANHAVLLQSLLQASQNNRDRFCASLEVHRVCSCEHTASSRLRLRVRGGHCNCSGNLQKRKDITVAFCKLRSLIAVAVAIHRSHRGCLSRSRGIFVIAFVICSSFFMAAFASTWHCHNPICDLQNHLWLLLATRGIHCNRFSARSRTHHDHSCKVAGKGRAWLSSILVAEADGAKS